MKDSRYKEIMDGLGMPNSRSLLSALQQVANEVAQEVHKSYEKNNKKLNTGAYKCKICKNEIVNNGFKWIHGRAVYGSIEIGKTQPRHKAVPCLNTKNNQLLHLPASHK